MRRIGLVAILLVFSLVSAPSPTQAQPADKVRRIGFLSGTSRSPVLFRDTEGLTQGLREHGYVEGQNLLIEWRFAEGRSDRLPDLAAELIRLKVEVLVTVSSPAAIAAKNATAAIPIVFTQVPDPIALGIVSSLAQPGGNLTGFAQQSVELTGKRLELLKEAVPPLKSVVILTDSANPTRALGVQEAQSVARRLGLEARLIEVRDADELEPTFTTIARERSRGVVMVPSTFLVTHGIQIAELAIKRRLPLLGWTDSWAKLGALVSYGPSTFDTLRRAGGHVAKILDGVKPGNLPVEQPTKFELIINLKTAKALGLTIPQSVLLRADQIIE
jgi:ABC-type uncharacterized transport system substrate-binding protein